MENPGQSAAEPGGDFRRFAVCCGLAFCDALGEMDPSPGSSTATGRLPRLDAQSHLRARAALMAVISPQSRHSFSEEPARYSVEFGVCTASSVHAGRRYRSYPLAPLRFQAQASGMGNDGTIRTHCRRSNGNSRAIPLPFFRCHIDLFIRAFAGEHIDGLGLLALDRGPDGRLVAQRITVHAGRSFGKRSRFPAGCRAANLAFFRGSLHCGISLGHSRQRPTRSAVGGPPDLTDELGPAIDVSARGPRLWLLHSRRIDTRLAERLRLHAGDAAPSRTLS